MERELRIYIAEDDVGVIDTLRDFIEDQGLGEVVGSSEDDGGDALQIVALQPDLILIDFLMPGQDGAELVRRLREKGCRAKCIMLSQVTQKDMIAKAYDAGIDFFLNKPINIVERGHRHRRAAARKRENHRGAAPRAVFGSAGSAAGHG